MSSKAPIQASYGDSYPADGPGLLLIINFKEHRKGSEHDTRRLLEFFGKELGFDICRADEDMTESEFIDCLESVKYSLDKTYYCFICIVMGHGDETGIQTKDDKRIPTDRILKTFDNIHMTSFAGKPKWFIINACRGNSKTKTTTSQLKTDKAIENSQTQKKVAIEGSDVAAFKSTIQESYTTSDIDDMMREVNKILQETVQQVAEKTTTMTRKLHLVKNTSNHIQRSEYINIERDVTVTNSTQTLVIEKERTTQLFDDSILHSVLLECGRKSIAIGLWQNKFTLRDEHLNILQTYPTKSLPKDVALLGKNKFAILMRNESITIFSMDTNNRITEDKTIKSSTNCHTISGISSRHHFCYKMWNSIPSCQMMVKKLVSAAFFHLNETAQATHLHVFKHETFFVMSYYYDNRVYMYNTNTGVCREARHECFQNIYCMRLGSMDNVLMMSNQGRFKFINFEMNTDRIVCTVYKLKTNKSLEGEPISFCWNGDKLIIMCDILGILSVSESYFVEDKCIMI